MQRQNRGKAAQVLQSLKSVLIETANLALEIGGCKDVKEKDTPLQ